MSVKQPRGSQCFVCRESSLTGLRGLPSGGHLIAAPYLTGTQAARPSGDPGTPLVNDPPTTPAFTMRGSPPSPIIAKSTVEKSPTSTLKASRCRPIATNSGRCSTSSCPMR